ncbi:MAG: hypothetical protein ABSA11_05770 [Candidatus Bathyarchaeia archaeon]
MRSLQQALIRMSLEDVLKLIDESKKFLEPYRIYGQMIMDGIAQLESLEKLVKEEKIPEAYALSCSMCEQITQYRSFVPQLADNMERVREILKSSC